jgi:hypothetical protein
MDHRNLRSGLFPVVISVWIAGCGPDMGTVKVPAQGPSEVPTPTTPTSPAPLNRTPMVSGTPATSVSTGANYSFTPAATDADGDALVWSISGKPADAVFSPATGSLTWTPDQPGTWSNIRITVTDSKGSSASLAPFSIEVLAVAPSGSASLSWTSPSQYTDGSLLPASDLSGFAIYSGTSTNALHRVAEVDGRTTSFVVGNLGAGTHYFAVTAIASSGAESAFSSIGQKTISAL